MTLYPRLTLVHDHAQSDGMSATLPNQSRCFCRAVRLQYDRFWSLLLTPAKHGRRGEDRGPEPSAWDLSGAGPCGAQVPSASPKRTEFTRHGTE